MHALRTRMKRGGPVVRRALLGVTLAIAAAAFGADSATAANVLQVPQEYPTIQAAIDAAAPGDTVSVSPGVYHELIDNHSKAITIESTSGAGETTVDGDALGPVVTLTANLGESPVLKGFTIQDGRSLGDGGGVITSGGSPVIEDNVIVSNVACDGGGGIVVGFASTATILDNTISHNSQCFGFSGGVGGGGIALLYGSRSVQIVGNRIVNNSFSGASGGGISLFGAGSPTISGNLISGNAAGGDGGGIWIVNDSTPLISNNLIVGNTAGLIGTIVPAGAGGGIYWSGFWMGALQVINNTIALNIGSQGSAVYANAYQAGELVNNVVYGSDPGSLVYCGNVNTQNPPSITFNDVFNTGSGTGYGGICADQTGTNGDIASDPLFVDLGSGDFHLQASSPAIDAGTNTGAPTVDFDGNPRPIDGNHDGVAITDMGAYEYRPADTTPPVISVPAPITVNATSASGAIVTYTVTATDPDDAVASLVCSPASGSMFPIGMTAVNCTATDTHGNTSRASFTVTVKGAPEQLADLLAAVTGVGSLSRAM